MNTSFGLAVVVAIIAVAVTIWAIYGGRNE